MTPPAGVFAHIAGEDLVQGQDGRWWVLEDNLCIPSGARVFGTSRRVGWTFREKCGIMQKLLAQRG